MTTLEAVKPYAAWCTEGARLGAAWSQWQKRGSALMWEIGVWWNLGTAYGDRVEQVHNPEWTGPPHAVCRNAGYVVSAFQTAYPDVSLCSDTFKYNGVLDLSFSHYTLLAPLVKHDRDAAQELAKAARDNDWTVSQLREQIAQSSSDAVDDAPEDNCEPLDAYTNSRARRRVKAARMIVLSRARNEQPRKPPPDWRHLREGMHNSIILINRLLDKIVYNMRFPCLESLESREDIEYGIVIAAELDKLLERVQSMSDRMHEVLPERGKLIRRRLNQTN